MSIGIVLIALVAGVGWAIRGPAHQGPLRGLTRSSSPVSSPSSSPTDRSRTGLTIPHPHTRSSPAVSMPPTTPSSGVRARPAVRTPGGMWWGVDSSGPITAAAIANVKGWYQGARPQFWGRYVNGSYAVSRHELAYARHRGIYVALLVTDRNCSQCDDGGDICGNDETRTQADSDGHAAIAAAHRVGARPGALLIKDTEQISSCRGEPSADYLLAWYRTVHRSGYRIGFYGNVHGQDYDFPRDFCAARERNRDFASDVVLDMDENEPRLGAAQGTTGPHNAPAFRPQFPDCVARSAIDIWQYGESIDSENYADIDQARPDTPGLLTPDHTITGD